MALQWLSSGRLCCVQWQLELAAWRLLRCNFFCCSIHFHDVAGPDGDFAHNATNLLNVRIPMVAEGNILQESINFFDVCIPIATRGDFLEDAATLLSVCITIAADGDFLEDVANLLSARNNCVRGITDAGTAASYLLQYAIDLLSSRLHRSRVARLNKTGSYLL